MCIALWYIMPPTKGTSRLRFALMFNREEYSDRPTEPLTIIDNELICGRDIREGGTWLCLNIKTGVIAFLTNRNILNQQTLTCKIKFFCQMLIDLIPLKIQRLLRFQSYKSRGKLILGLCKPQKSSEDTKLNEVKQISADTRYFQTSLPINTNQNDELQKLFKETKQTKNQYRPFNLIFGSLESLDFNYLCQSNEASSNSLRLEDGYGSVCNFSDLGDEILKQRIGKQKFKEIIDRYNSSKSDISEVVDQLFGLALEKFRSNEKFFISVPNQATFYIPQNKGLNARKMGTRTTTVVLYDGNDLKVFEKTYI